jgi:16S rRNA (cytosine1402-N4)-methyltransferase
VLLEEMLEALGPRAGETYIDGTFGAGGYSRAIIAAAPCRVLALDRDPEAVRDGYPLTVELAPRLTLVHSPFSDMDKIAGSLGFVPADGVVLDIGVSSMQLDEAERGFSFQSDGPLDMRMSGTGPSAADFVNSADESEIADVIYRFGEEHKSRAIARAIVRARTEKPITRTLELAAIVLRAFHGRRPEGKHPATRTFQALRIHVNDELGELERGLAAAERILKPGGRLVVVSFHSLEDRIVKHFLAGRSGRTPQGSRHLPQTINFSAPSFRILNLRPLTPEKGELDVNPRARSSRLRAAVRTEAPPRG